MGVKIMLSFEIWTAIEIFSNPYDLEISIIHDRNSGQFAICINRGPNNNYKPLFTPEPFTKSLNIAVNEVKLTLETIYTFIKFDLENVSSDSTLCLNPNGLGIDWSKVMSLNLINQITCELGKKPHKVSTCNMMCF